MKGNEMTYSATIILLLLVASFAPTAWILGSARMAFKDYKFKKATDQAMAIANFK